MTETQLWKKNFPGSLNFNPNLERHIIKQHTFNKAGIYYWFNTITKKGYVGRSENLYYRVIRYYQNGYLNYKTIVNLPIARAILKYTLANFVLIILEITNKEDLCQKEQYYIDTLNSDYNVMKIRGLRPQL